MGRERRCQTKGTFLKRLPINVYKSALLQGNALFLFPFFKQIVNTDCSI
jgi:hypothetical protein